MIKLCCSWFVIYSTETVSSCSSPTPSCLPGRSQEFIPKFLVELLINSGHDIAIMLLFYVQLKSPEIMSYNWLGREAVRKKVIFPDILVLFCWHFNYNFYPGSHGWSSSLSGWGVWGGHVIRAAAYNGNGWGYLYSRQWSSVMVAVEILISLWRQSQCHNSLSFLPSHQHILTIWQPFIACLPPWLWSLVETLNNPVIKNSKAGPSSFNWCGSGGEVLSFL